MKQQTRIEQVGAVLEITLDDPERLNPLGEQMNAEILAGLKRANEDDAVRSVLITGAGRAFSAGADLNEAAMQQRPDLGKVIQDRYNPVGEMIVGMCKPVVCAVNGIAAGAGANLALCCDIVVAARSAGFLQAFAKIGLLPDLGGTYFLPRLVGRARATALAMLAEPLPAETAEQWGLIWKCVDDDQLMDRARAIAMQLAAMPPLGLGAIKRALHESIDNSFIEQVTLERDLQRELGFTDDFAEGTRAFFEKRKPVFTGR
ncbi:enoyl-CoA hydratase-related protein [Burkholderia sp. D-99]|uniref:enoyl-CoA hydratase-related protein n=1 Tax=Burkholderia sp. D-99 TaxID=2717316 RepID=UPI0014230D1A|nr:enoyl-CoA hydratase-related protein [Burkholderia sp. D-99]NHV25894.1 2-(1,2-epoxy-1,2-dihydrophenyl)acetyl-CoA isomerase [Burkholderia sp. D-99]